MHGGYTVNWTNSHVDEANNAHQEWFTYHLGVDFMQFLREFGTTPPTTSKAIIDRFKKGQEFERQANALKQKDTAVVFYESKITEMNEQLID